MKLSRLPQYEHKERQPLNDALIRTYFQSKQTGLLDQVRKAEFSAMRALACEL